MKDAEQALFGLMAVAEEQQAGVRDALAGFAAQREALERQEVLLEGCAALIQTEVARLRRATDEVGPGLALATRGAAVAAVEQGLAGAGRTATAAVEGAARPMLERLEGVAAEAERVEASLRRTVAWASWRLLGWGVVVVGCLAGLLWGAHLSVWWWSERDMARLQEQRSLLQSEIAGLQAALQTAPDIKAVADIQARVGIEQIALQAQQQQAQVLTLWVAAQQRAEEQGRDQEVRAGADRVLDRLRATAQGLGQ